MPRPPLPPGWRERFVGGVRSRCIGKIEVTANRGQLCDYMIRDAGGSPPEYYCMDAMASTAKDVLGHASPLLLSGSCEQQRARARANGALRSRAEFEATRARDPMLVAGWLFLAIDISVPGGHAHHTGMVGDVDELTGLTRVNGPNHGFLTCEANAADPKAAASRNGDGFYHGRERGTAADAATYEFIDLEAL